MSDLISRAVLLDELEDELEWEKAQSAPMTATAAFKIAMRRVKNAPAVDAEPVRHGRWEYVRTSDGGRLQCMECLHYIDVGDDKNYCPNCGARMDLEGKNDE